jgi:probable rRNA maturation factor
LPDIDSGYSLSIDVDAPYESLVDDGALLQAMGETLKFEQVATPAELSLIITDNDTVQELNRDYRGLDSPTDVLSFSFLEESKGDEGFVDAPDGVTHLGEVIIAYPYSAASAERQGHSVAKELLVLTVHGTLHILGYDDEEEEAAVIMFDRQNRILASLESSG